METDLLYHPGWAIWQKSLAQIVSNGTQGRQWDTGPGTVSRKNIYFHGYDGADYCFISVT